MRFDVNRFAEELIVGKHAVSVTDTWFEMNHRLVQAIENRDLRGSQSGDRDRRCTKWNLPGGCLSLDLERSMFGLAAAACLVYWSRSSVV